MMSDARRTTLTAPTEDLRTLEAEAARRGVSLSTVLREAVEEKARALRARDQPRLGLARSTDGRRASEVATEPVTERPR